MSVAEDEFEVDDLDWLSGVCDVCGHQNPGALWAGVACESCGEVSMPLEREEVQHE